MGGALRAKTEDGWLLVDGERAFKLKRIAQLAEAVREVRKGALLGVLTWWEDDNFDWLTPPTPGDPKTRTDELTRWLRHLEAETNATSRMAPFEWSVWAHGSGQHAVLLAPDE
jgi:hypothetical protein